MPARRELLSFACLSKAILLYDVSARVLITKSDGANKLINRGNLINSPPRIDHRAEPKVMILAHATLGMPLFSFSFSPFRFFSLPRTVSLSFQPLVRRFSHQPSFISSSFHPRLSSRAQSAVTKIDFLAGTRESAGEIEYIAVSRPSFDFSLLAGALLHRRFIPRARARFFEAASASPVKFSRRLIKKKRADSPRFHRPAQLM